MYAVCLYRSLKVLIEGHVSLAASYIRLTRLHRSTHDGATYVRKQSTVGSDAVTAELDERLIAKREKVTQCARHRDLDVDDVGDSLSTLRTHSDRSS